MFDFHLWAEMSVIFIDEDSHYEVRTFADSPDGKISWHDVGVYVETVIDGKRVDEYFIQYYSDYNDDDLRVVDPFDYADLCERGIEYWKE